jgi:energy-coupling factor transporter ATP-binding protein EcfA2
MPPTRAFAQHNLRWNPFEELPLSERPSVAVNVPQLEVKAGQAILFLGERGRGKTTHLLTLHAQHSHAPYIYLPPFGKMPRIPKSEVLFLDEAQRLPRLFRWRFWLRARAWVIASHQNHQPELERLGFKVRVFYLQGLSLQKLEQIVEKRLSWARRAQGQIPQVPRQVLLGLLEQHGDNLRAIEDVLYDYYQGFA